MCDWPDHPPTCPYLRVREASLEELIDRWCHVGVAGARAAWSWDELSFRIIEVLSKDVTRELIRRNAPIIDKDPRYLHMRETMEREGEANKKAGRKLPPWYGLVYMDDRKGNPQKYGETDPRSHGEPNASA